MSDVSLPKVEKRFNCPACGAEDSVPEDSIVEQVSQSPRKQVVYHQGTCLECRSTRTQWVEDMNGNAIEETERYIVHWETRRGVGLSFYQGKEIVQSQSADMAEAEARLMVHRRAFREFGIGHIVITEVERG